jgi:hypothetical protein
MSIFTSMCATNSQTKKSSARAEWKELVREGNPKRKAA